MKKIFLAASFILFIVSCRKDTNTVPLIDKSLNQKSVGTSANDFLSGRTYSSILVEVQYMPGYQLSEASLNQLAAFVSRFVNKPLGIQIVQKEIPASNKLTLTTQEVVAIEKQNRTVYSNGSQLGVYILVTDGNSDQPNILGFAYRNTSIGLYGKFIRDNSDRLGRPSRATLESTVLDHEFGHLFGLVNLGSPMVSPHEDAAHLNHCNNNQCLMYYASTSMQMMINSPVSDLDLNCKNDLRANGGK